MSLRPTGTVATLGVRFRPGSAAALLHMPQRPLLGTTHGVDALDGRLARDLAAIRDRARSMDDAVDQVQRYLCTRIDSRWSDPRVLAAVETIRRHGGQMAIDDLATRIGMTRRHLERRFDTLVGISPKRLARIVRFQRALQNAAAAGGSGVTTAVECGYADQPHFIREFTELAGCSPGAHLLRHAELSGLFTRTPHRHVVRTFRSAFRSAEAGQGRPKGLHYESYGRYSMKTDLSASRSGGSSAEPGGISLLLSRKLMMSMTICGVSESGLF